MGKTSGVEQLEALWLWKSEVAGSSPAPAISLLQTSASCRVLNSLAAVTRATLTTEFPTKVGTATLRSRVRSQVARSSPLVRETLSASDLAAAVML